MVRYVDWNNLSLNSNAIHILEQNQIKINWEYFSMNENIFEYEHYLLK